MVIYIRSALPKGYNYVSATMNTALPVPWMLIHKDNLSGYTTSTIKSYTRAIISPLTISMMIYAMVVLCPTKIVSARA